MLWIAKLYQKLLDGSRNAPPFEGSGYLRLATPSQGDSRARPIAQDWAGLCFVIRDLAGTSAALDPRDALQSHRRPRLVQAACAMLLGRGAGQAPSPSQPIGADLGQPPRFRQQPAISALLLRYSLPD